MCVWRSLLFLWTLLPIHIMSFLYEFVLLWIYHFELTKQNVCIMSHIYSKKIARSHNGMATKSYYYYYVYIIICQCTFILLLRIAISQLSVYTCSAVFKHSSHLLCTFLVYVVFFLSHFMYSVFIIVYFIDCTFIGTESKSNKQNANTKSNNSSLCRPYCK